MTPSRRAWSRVPLVAALAFIATSLAHAQGVEAPRVPLRTAISEINTLRSEYAEAYNSKSAGALTAMYLPDAVMVRHDGSTLLGQAEIGKALAEDAASVKRITISSDTMRVFGNTAWDVGTSTRQGEDGNTTVSRYLVVLRRGLQGWKISTSAVVPETRATAAK
jgi:ketosteroid isomerase-like protein